MCQIPPPPSALPANTHEHTRIETGNIHISEYVIQCSEIRKGAILCWRFGLYTLATFLCGPGSVVAIATAYGLDGRGIESRWGEIFRTCPDRP